MGRGHASTSFLPVGVWCRLSLKWMMDARVQAILCLLFWLTIFMATIFRLDSNMVTPYPAELVQLVAQAGDLYLCEVDKVRL